jgi:hypothetical protein
MQIASTLLMLRSMPKACVSKHAGLLLSPRAARV